MQMLIKINQSENKAVREMVVDAFAIDGVSFQETEDYNTGTTVTRLDILLKGQSLGLIGDSPEHRKYLRSKYEEITVAMEERYHDV